MVDEKRLIDANFALKRLKNNFMINEPAKAWIRRHIETCPTVDAVEVVHGRWIPSYTVNWWMGTETIDGFTCNQCARHFKSKLRLNYCPNCGAKMDGDKYE